MSSEDKFKTHPYWASLGVGVKVIIIVFVLAVVMIPLSLAFGWFSGEANIYSFSHVRQEYQFGYDYDRSMVATAQNVCAAKSTGADSQTILAYTTTYNNNEATYDARMADTFRAKRVKPGDLPLVAPTLKERIRALQLKGEC